MYGIDPKAENGAALTPEEPVLLETAEGNAWLAKSK